MIKITYKHYLLGLLVLVATVMTMERFVFSLAMEPIKQDLGLSDSQLGLMTGIAFAAFYAIAGIPLARWADRGNRATIVTLSACLYGVMVSLCGLAGSFFQLLLVRAGLAVGEAGLTPSAQSLLADYFERAKRPGVMAVFFSSYTLSMIVGYLLGGQLIDAWGWRTTFIIMGLPGIVLAVIVKLTVREPRLTRPEANITSAPALRETVRTLWQQRTFRQILLAFCVGYFFFMGLSTWMAAFFMRIHGMTPTEVGAWLALAYGFFGLLGNYAGGYWANRFAACRERLQMRTVACLFVLGCPVSVVLYLSPNPYIALMCVVFQIILGGFGNGSIFAAMQSLVQENMRSMAVAITFLFANLIGFGFGPLALGLLSDLLQPVLGEASLRYALVLFAPGYLWVAYYYWQAGHTIEADIRGIDEEAGIGTDHRPAEA